MIRFALPDTVTAVAVITVTVGVTIVVPSQDQLRGGLHLTLAQTVFVPFPVKIPHVSHVQSRGERWRHVRMENKT